MDKYRYLTPAEIMDMLQLSSSSVYSMLGSEIPCVKVGRSLRVDQQEFEDFLLKSRHPRSSWWTDTATDQDEDSDDAEDDEDSSKSSWWVTGNTEDDDRET